MAPWSGIDSRPVTVGSGSGAARKAPGRAQALAHYALAVSEGTGACPALLPALASVGSGNVVLLLYAPAPLHFENGAQPI